GAARRRAAGSWRWRHRRPWWRRLRRTRSPGWAVAWARSSLAPGRGPGVDGGVKGRPGSNEVGAHAGHDLAATAQGRGRVIGRQENSPILSKGVRTAPQLRDPPAGIEQQPGGEVAEGDDHPGLDQRQLLLEVGPAGRDLLG